MIEAESENSVVDLFPGLKPETEYFDATEAMQAMAETIRELKSQIDGLQGLYEMQLSINQKLLDNLGGLTLRVAELEKPSAKPSIIIPGRLQ